MLEIDSIETIAVQGMTKPLVCRADDGQRYVVKYAAGVTVNGLVKEWIAACLANELGFKVPKFMPALIHQELIDAFPDFVKHEVASKPVGGVVFASKWQEHTEEFKFVNIEEVPLKQQQNLWVFDLWIGNDDRSLTEKGGNVNLLWSVKQKNFYVIDHNLAFQGEFDGEFLSMHVFKCSVEKPYPLDLVTREEYQRKLQEALNKWDNYVSSCPAEWQKNELFNLDLDEIYHQLQEDANGALWDKLI